MKILPVNYNFFIPKTLQTNPFRMSVNFGNAPADSFEASQINNESYVKDAMNSSKIHCPICNVKMLSQKDFDKLLEKAGKINSTNEFIDLLDEYKEFIPKNMYSIYEKSLNKEKFEGRTFHEYVGYQNAKAFYKHCAVIEETSEFMKNVLEKYPQEDKQKILDGLESLKPSEAFYQYKQKVLEPIKTANIEEQDRRILLKKVFNDVKNSAAFFKIFMIPDRNEMSVSDLSKLLFSRIFENSVVRYSPISKIWNDEDKNNEILLCNHCDSMATAGSFLSASTLDDPNFKEHLKIYLQDISVELGAKNLEPNTAYIDTLLGFISMYSKQKVKLEPYEIDSLKHLHYAVTRHESFEPIAQTDVDIHCAGCGAVMLPYAKRVEITKELSKAESLSDYVSILEKYSKYINSYSHPVAKAFINIVKENPDISNDEFIKLLQKKVDNKCKVRTEKAIFACAKNRDYIKQNKSADEYNTYDIVLNRVWQYYKSGKFNDYSYTTIFDEVLKDIDIESNCPPPVYALLTELRQIGFINHLAKPNNYDSIRDKDPVFSIVFNIFKADFATVDHLVAMSRSGGKSKNNLIGLCKTCNSVTKARKTVYTWMKQDSRVRYNLPKQLKDVDDMSKNGQIKGYDDWAKNIADKVYELTKGKFDVRNKK